MIVPINQPILSIQLVHYYRRSVFVVSGEPSGDADSQAIFFVATLPVRRNKKKNNKDLMLPLTDS